MSYLSDNAASRLPEPGTRLTVSPWPYRARGEATRGFWAIKEVPGLGVVLTFTKAGKPAGWKLTASTPKEPHLDPSPEVGEEILESLPKLKDGCFRTRREALLALESSIDAEARPDSALGEIL